VFTVRTVRLLLCLACLSAASAAASSARLLQAEDVPAASGEGAPPLVEVAPAPAAPAPQVVLVPAATATTPDRSAKLLWGLVTVGGLGVGVSGRPIVGGLVLGAGFSNFAYSSVSVGLLLAGAGLTWLVTPLIVTTVMDGFPVWGRAVLGALAGWAGSILLTAALSATPFAWLGGLLVLSLPGLGGRRGHPLRPGPGLPAGGQ